MARGSRQTEACAFCGLLYRDFRAEGQPDFDSAHTEAVRRSVEAHLEGNYKVQGRRGSTLMVMFEYKQLGWKEHLYWCRVADEAGYKPDGG